MDSIEVRYNSKGEVVLVVDGIQNVLTIAEAANLVSRIMFVVSCAIETRE